MTGMSPPQCGRPTQTGYEHVSDLWAKALLAGGAEVHHRRVEPNEDLTGYDVALIGLVPPNSIAARYMYTAFDVIARAKASGCGLLFYVDDWRFYAVPHGVRVVANNPTRRLKESSIFDKLWHREWALSDDGWPIVTRVLEALRDQRWPTTLIPQFTWGNDELMPELPAQRLVHLDPSAFARKYEIPIADDNDRRRAWVLGTFSDQRDWQASLNLGWEADYIGTRRSKAERRLKEPELVKLYGDAWGVLAAPYGHSGSGWWRNRFVYSAAGHAVLLSDEREVAGLPGYWKSAAEIENMTTQELVVHASQQRALMQNSYAPAESVSAEMLRLCREAHAKVQGSTAVENAEPAA
jgi:hypothetical protein